MGTEGEGETGDGPRAHRLEGGRQEVSRLDPVTTLTGGTGRGQGTGDPPGPQEGGTGRGQGQGTESGDPAPPRMTESLVPMLGSRVPTTGSLKPTTGLPQSMTGSQTANKPLEIQIP